MLRITIELWPGGDPARKQTLHVADIYNTLTTPDNSTGDYGARFYRKGPIKDGLLYRPKPIRVAGVKSFPRLRKNAWHLLAQVLLAAGYG